MPLKRIQKDPPTQPPRPSLRKPTPKTTPAEVPPKKASAKEALGLSKLESQSAAIPSLYRLGLAELWTTDHLEKPGRKALEEFCRSRGLTFGIIATFERGDEVHVAVHIGISQIGRALRGKEDRGLHAWDAVDEALGSLAKNLRETLG